MRIGENWRKRAEEKDSTLENVQGKAYFCMYIKEDNYDYHSFPS